MEMEKIKEVAQDKLSSAGYKKTSGHSYAIATKDVDSYGGDSNIVIWLTKGDEYNDACLDAEYTIRGNNVLSTTNIRFEKGISHEKVSAEMDRFINKVTNIIDKSVIKKVSPEKITHDELDSKYVKTYEDLKSHQRDFESEIKKMPIVDIPDGYDVLISIKPSANYEQEVKISINKTNSTNDGIEIHTANGEIAKMKGASSSVQKITDSYLNILTNIKDSPVEFMDNLNKFNQLAIAHIKAKKELDNQTKAPESTSSKPSIK